MISAAAQVEESAKDKADEMADDYEEQEENKAIATPQWFGKKEEVKSRQPMPWNTPVVAHLPLGCLHFFMYRREVCVIVSCVAEGHAVAHAGRRGRAIGNRHHSFTFQKLEDRNGI